jgi:hypothetical protein
MTGAVPQGAKKTVRPALLVAAIPVVDALINQLFGAGAALGAFSGLQAARGAQLGLLVVLAVWAFLRQPRINRQLATLVVFVSGAVLCILGSELRRYGSIGIGSIVGVAQLLYVVILWVTAAAVCKQPRDGHTVLVGISVGALITAVSILVVYVRGTHLTQVYGGIAATSGLFFSAKYLVGTLVLGGLTWLYLSGKRRRALGAVAAALCFLALFATYNRTGQVCLLVAVLWLARWYFGVGRDVADRAWVGRLLLLCGVTVALFVVVVGTTDLALRWSDLADRDTAGSGRILLWGIATSWLLIEAELADLLTGGGFRGMFDIIEAAAGIRVHTHSDLFDLLVVAGLYGGLTYLVILRTMYLAAKRGDHRSSARALGCVAFITFLLASLVTGQITQPSAMATYVLVLAATSAITRAHGAKVASADVKLDLSAYRPV